MKTTRLESLDEATEAKAPLLALETQPLTKSEINKNTPHLSNINSVGVVRFLKSLCATIVVYSWYAAMVVAVYWVSMKVSSLMVGVPVEGFRVIVSTGVAMFSAYVFGPWRNSPWSSTSIGLGVMKVVFGSAIRSNVVNDIAVSTEYVTTKKKPFYVTSKNYPSDNHYSLFK